MQRWLQVRVINESLLDKGWGKIHRDREYTNDFRHNVKKSRDFWLSVSAFFSVSTQQHKRTVQCESLLSGLCLRSYTPRGNFLSTLEEIATTTVSAAGSASKFDQTIKCSNLIRIKVALPLFLFGTTTEATHPLSSLSFVEKGVSVVHKSTLVIKKPTRYP